MATHPSTDPVRITLAMPGLLAMLGLRQLIEQIPGTEISGTASCRDGLARAMRAQRPDVLLVDPELLAEARVPIALEGTRVLHVSPYPHPRAQATTTGGACGFLSERSALDRVCDALEIITRCAGPNGSRGFCGRCPLSASLRPAPVPALTPRELEVFALISEGLGSTALSQRLQRSVKTIETHRENIKRKLGLGSSMDLVDLARRWSRGESVDDLLPARPMT